MEVVFRQSDRLSGSEYILGVKVKPSSLMFAEKYQPPAVMC